MKAIPLTRGKVAFVDDCDFEWLNQFKWHATKIRKSYYATRNGTRTATKRQRIYMHREILNAPKGKGVDHKDHDGLMNVRSNIRICSYGQNGANRLPQKNAISRYKGVVKSGDRWKSKVYHDGKGICLGFSDSEIEAAIRYDTKAKELFGEFALTNEMLDLI